MKRFKLVFALLIAMVFGLNAEAQVKWHDIDFDEAMELAAKENKMVFIDFFFNGCAPCYTMKTKVFTKKEIGDFYNKHFICVSYNINVSEDLRNLAFEANLGSFPGYAFYDPKIDDLVHAECGLREGTTIIDVAKRALTPKKNSVYFDEQWIDENKDLDFLADYYQFAVASKNYDMPKKIMNRMLKYYSQEKVDAKLAAIK